MVTKTFNPRCCCWAVEIAKAVDKELHRTVSFKTYTHREKWRQRTSLSKKVEELHRQLQNSRVGNPLQVPILSFFFSQQNTIQNFTKMPEVQQMLSLHLNSQTHQLNKAHCVDLEPPKKKEDLPSKQVQAKQRMQSPLKYKQQQHLHLQQTHCKKYYGKKLKPLFFAVLPYQTKCHKK